MIRAATSLIALLLTAPVGSETVDVRDRGTIDLATFECRDINRSSLIQRVCYDHVQRTLIVGIKGNYDDYCELPQRTFESFMTAPSMGQFFNQNIRGSGPDARYDCGAHQRAKHQPAAAAIGT
jgi:KTSC domain